MMSSAEADQRVRDWSTLHQAAGSDLYQTPQVGEWTQYLLTPDKVDRFWAEGYLSNIRVLSEEQCDLILQDYKYFMDDSLRHPGHDMLYVFHSNQSGDPDNVLMHCLGHWRLTRLFHDLVFHPKIVVPCSQLLQRGEKKSVRFWHDQLFAKPPKHGGNVAWHQDYSYWTRTKPCMHITVHVALDDHTDENGGLMYIPGSQRWTRDGDPLPVTDFNFKDMESIRTILTEEELKNFKPKPANLKKGEASFHHSLSVHGSYGNRSSKPRRSAVCNYFADGVKSDTDSGLLVNDGDWLGDPNLHNSNIPKGGKMEGQFFPLVFDTDWLE